MSPIQYLEATCDRCNKEIGNVVEDAEFGILRSGQLVCAECRDKRPDHEHFRNFMIPQLKMKYDDDEEPEPKEKYYCLKCKGKHFRESKIGIEHACFEIPDVEKRWADSQEPEEGAPPYEPEEEPDAIDRAREEQLDRKC